MRLAVIASLVGLSQAFLLPVTPVRPARLQTLQAIPLELEGELDPSKSWDVKLTLNGETKVLTVPEDTCILEAALKEWEDAPNSCRNGICTTCSAIVTAGRDNVKEAVHGLSPDQSAKGFILTCQSYATGPGIEITLNQYNTVYEEQYGKYEKNASKEGKKKFSLFG